MGIPTQTIGDFVRDQMGDLRPGEVNYYPNERRVEYVPPQRSREIIYLIGSLRNPRVPEISAILRELGHEVFDDWHAAGPTADDCWLEYERARGRTYAQALREGYAAEHVFQFDLKHLNRATMGLLLMPAGKSGHLELGYLMGQGKPGYVLFEDGEPERWDIMYKFAADVFFSVEEMKEGIG